VVIVIFKLMSYSEQRQGGGAGPEMQEIGPFSDQFWFQMVHFLAGLFDGCVGLMAIMAAAVVDVMFPHDNCNL
jgi:hypothetical protein